MRSFLRRNPGGDDSGEDTDKAAPKRSPMPYLLALLVLQVIAYAVVLNIVGPDTSGRQISLDRFSNLVDSGEVREVTILDYDSRVTGRDSDGEFWLALPRGELAVNQLSTQLSSSGISTTIDQQTYKGILNFLAQFLLPVLLFFTLFGALFLLFVGGSGMGGLTLFGKSRARRYGEADEKVTFADVAGLDETVKELEEIKDFLSAPERFVAMGAKVPKGVLLTGPPGCGKTLLARAVAGEAGVPFFSVAASEFVEMLVGVGASRVRDLFRQAREHAPSIIFIDELDAVGRSRSGGAVMGNDERDQTLNEMLVQMDGFGSDTRVVVITATNRADVLDEALTRPGRFDRRIVVDRPDIAGREAILRVHAAGKPIDVDVDLATIARRTPGFSGADLANVLNEAALLAARRGLSSIGRPEVQEGIDRVIAGPERSRILSPAEKRRVAVHEAGHALVATILPNADPLEKVSVVARGTSLGHVQVVPEHDRYLMTRTQLLDRITVSLAGRLAELEVFGESSNGASSDLEMASGLARHMVMDLGMSEALPALSYRRNIGEVAEHSPRMADAIDGAIAVLIATAEEQALHILRAHRAWLDRLASELEERETLHREDLETLLGGLTRAAPPVPSALPIDARST